MSGSTVEAAGVNPYGINTILVNGVSTFFIIDNPTFINGSRSLPGNPPDCIIVDIESLIFYPLMSFSEKPCEDCPLIYYSILNYVENYFHQCLSCVMITLELRHSHFLLQTLIYPAKNLIP